MKHRLIAEFGRTGRTVRPNLADQIEMLIDKCEKVDVKTIGFSRNWKELLQWRTYL